MSCYYSPTEIKDHMLNTQAALNKLLSFPAKDAGYINTSMLNFIEEAKAGKYDSLTDEEYEELRNACVFKKLITESDFNVIACKAQELSSMISSFIHRNSDNMANNISIALSVDPDNAGGPLFEGEYDDYKAIAKNLGCDIHDFANFYDDSEDESVNEIETASPDNENKFIHESLHEISETLASIAEKIDNSDCYLNGKNIHVKSGNKDECDGNCDKCTCDGDCDKCEDADVMSDNTAVAITIKSMSDVIGTIATVLAEACLECDEECSCMCSSCNKCGSDNPESTPTYDNEDDDYYDPDMEYDIDGDDDYDDFYKFDAAYDVDNDDFAGCGEFVPDED